MNDVKGWFWAIWIMVLLGPWTRAAQNNPFQVQGFYLDMSKQEINQIFEQFKNVQTAKHITIKNEKYRTSITFDNDFSSMGNKIDIFYNSKGKANDITFQYKTVDILFKATDLSAEQFMQNFVSKYQLPKMNFKDQGIVKLWIYKNKNKNLKISIDNHKNLRLQRIIK